MYLNEFDATMKLIQGKWKIYIIYYIHEQDTTRFNQLSRDLPDVSRKTLTLQLRQLEADGLIVRTTTSGYPLKVEYHLTPDGLSMIPVLDMICDRGNEHISPDLLAAKLCD